MTDILVFDHENALMGKFFMAVKRQYPVGNAKCCRFVEFRIHGIQKTVSCCHSNASIAQYRPILQTVYKQKTEWLLMTLDAHLFQPSGYYRGQYVSLTGRLAEIKSDFLLIYVWIDYPIDGQKPHCNDGTDIERSCKIIEDNEVYNERDSLQSYRLLLIDKPVEGKFNIINSSQIGLNALFRKGMAGRTNYDAIMDRYFKLYPFFSPRKRIERT